MRGGGRGREDVAANTGAMAPGQGDYGKVGEVGVEQTRGCSPRRVAEIGWERVC